MADMDRSRDRTRRDRPTRFAESSRDRSFDRGRERQGMKSSNNRVYVSNIPYEFRWQDLKDLFRNEVGDVQFVELFVDENEKPKGCGIIEFSDPGCVKKCLEVMQRYDIKGRKIVVKEDIGNQRDKHGNIVGKRGGRVDNFREERYDGGSVRAEDKSGTTYGLSPQFLESLNIEPPLVNRVFVANLEYNVDKKKLKDVFRLAGKVQRVDLPVDKEGRSRGFALVEFDHPVEAVQAISMFHNQVLYDRHMSVRLDRANEILKLPEGLKSIGMGLGVNGEPLKNVSLNLPSLTKPSTAGTSILGSVPNPALQVANALSSLSNPLSSLTNQSVLQAATSLLGNGLGSSDLSLATSLVSNTLGQNQARNLSGGGGSNQSSNMSPFGRSDNNYQTGQSSGYGSVGNSGGGYQSNRGNYQSSFESPKQSSFGGAFGGSDRGNIRSGNDKNMGGVFNRQVMAGQSRF